MALHASVTVAVQFQEANGTKGQKLGGRVPCPVVWRMMDYIMEDRG